MTTTTKADRRRNPYRDLEDKDLLRYVRIGEGVALRTRARAMFLRAAGTVDEIPCWAPEEQSRKCRFDKIACPEHHDRVWDNLEDLAAHLEEHAACTLASADQYKAELERRAAEARSGRPAKAQARRR